MCDLHTHPDLFEFMQVPAALAAQTAPLLQPLVAEWAESRDGHLRQAAASVAGRNFDLRARTEVVGLRLINTYIVCHFAALQSPEL